MSARPLLALAVCAGLAVATGVAGAAPKAKPVCNLVVDEKGDGTSNIVLATGTPNDPAWDILSADVATKGGSLTTVIRVDKLAQSAASSPGGLQWRLNFTVGEAKLYTRVVVDTALGVSGSYGYVGTISETLGSADPVLDLAKNEVRLTVPLSGFSDQAAIKKSGTNLSDITASAGRFYNLGAVTASESSDKGVAAKPYATGAASCVAVGK